MTDPLSISASIVALLQLTQVAVTGLANIKEASKERSVVRDEIIYVSGLLFNLRGQVTRNEVWSGVVNTLSSPRGPLELLKEALEQLVKGLSPSGGLMRIGKSVAWPFQKKEVEEILRKIERQKSLIMLAMENTQL
jgi:hypothetical protein